MGGFVGEAIDGARTLLNNPQQAWQNLQDNVFGGPIFNESQGSERKLNPSKQDSPVWNDYDSVGNGRKTSGSGSKQRYYEWDHTHNDIEVYNRKGKHQGSMDPVTGEMYKPPVPGREMDKR